MDRPKPFTVGEYYHIYNRGVDKRNIFQDSRDWNRFRNGLYVCNTKKSVAFRSLPPDIFACERGETLTDIFAYVLMPNHFHLIVGEKRDGGISAFIGKLLTSYSMYFNTKYNRSGPLMCRPFRASHIDNDDYFRWVFAYVHLNPLQSSDLDWERYEAENFKSAKKRLAEYSYSSYVDYLSTRKESGVIAKEALPIDMSDILGDDIFATFREGKNHDTFTEAEKFLA